LDRPRLLEGNFERLLLLVRIELRGPPTAWVIVQPRHLLRLPPLQPLAHPIPIDLVDVGNLFQRVPALTEQHRVRAHARALGGGGFHNRAQLPALFGREGLHKFRRGFHTHYSTAELIPRCLTILPTIIGPNRARATTSVPFPWLWRRQDSRGATM